MPADYLKCVREGGEVRTLTGPREEKPKLKANEYIHVCIAPDGGRYWGEVKRKKTKKELEFLLKELKELIKCDKDFVKVLKKALVPSDIPELLKPGGIPIFQIPKKKKKKKRKKKKKKKKKKAIFDLEESLRKTTFKDIEKLGDLVVIPDFVSIVGSTIQRPEKEPNDIDIVIRSKRPDAILERKIRSQFHPDIQHKLHLIYQPEGPTSSYLPLYDLSLRPQKKLKIKNIDEDYPLKFSIVSPVDINPKALKELSDVELYQVHKKLHYWWNHTKYNREDLVNAHYFVLIEFKRRRMIHHSWDSLDAETYRLKKIDLADTKNVILGRSFRALKSGGGYGAGTYGDAKAAWKFWGQEFTEIAVEFKFDGERQVLHKKGDKVWLWSEDARTDYAKRLPQIINEALKIPHDFILDGETMIYDKGKKIARKDMPAYIRSKKPSTTTWKPVYKVFDCLYYNGQDLHNETWKNRQLFLKKIIKDGVYIKRVIPKIVNNKASFLVAVKAQRSKLESEGAMCKDTSSKYPLTGRTSKWAKIKNYKELHVRISKKKTTKVGTYTYECELSDGTPIGTTYATKINASIGTILSVYVAEVRIWETNGKKKFTWDNPIVHHLAEKGIPVTTPKEAEKIAVKKRGFKKEIQLEERIIDEPKIEAVKRALKKYNYYLDIPKGKKKFVYQHHWRGLNEDEAKSPENEIDPSHSVHGDLRFGMNGHLVGYSVFLGEGKDNIGGKDKLIDLSEKSKLQVGLKLTQPNVWLKVKGPSAPGSVGATSKTWATFYILDKGTYEGGVKREHFQEYFIKGSRLKGRYIIAYAPMTKIKTSLAGSFEEKIELSDEDLEELFLEDITLVEKQRRVWLISKPKDQRPYATTHKLEDVIKELKKKKQKYLVWAGPGITAKKIDIKKYTFKGLDTNDTLIDWPTFDVDNTITSGTKIIKSESDIHTSTNFIKSKNKQVIFLGTGPSTPVEGVGKNKRTNSSLFIKGPDILIDCTPQVEEQIKREKIKNINAVLISHAHRDACMGLSLLDKWTEKEIVIYAPSKVLAHKRLKKKFKNLILKPILPYKKTKIEGLTIIPFRVIHAEAFPTGKDFPCYGYKINNIVYAEDMENIPEKSEKYFKEARTIIIDSAMWFGKQIRGHMNTKQSLEFLNKFNPKIGILTQAGHTYPSFLEAKKKINEYWSEINGKGKIFLSYDGLKLSMK